MIDWSNRRVFLTGSGGFLGSVLHRRIAELGPAALFAPRKAELDLLDGRAVEDFLTQCRPDMVIHGAAVVGGIGANRRHPGRYFYENAMMGIQLIEKARQAGVAKFVCLGTICAYPKFTPVPFREEDLWNGYPEETNAPYGIAKRALLTQLQAYRQEFNFNGIFLLPVNLYGPGDNFDLQSGHVIPAMIRKVIEARRSGDKRVVLWGDGSPTREFLYVEDAAAAIIAAAAFYDSPEPVNLGTGREVTVSELARMIAELTGYTGEIVWDTTQPNGQTRRRLDVTRAAEAFDFRATTTLEEGLRDTVNWFAAFGERNDN